MTELYECIAQHPKHTDVSCHPKGERDFLYTLVLQVSPSYHLREIFFSIITLASLTRNKETNIFIDLNQFIVEFIEFIYPIKLL